jgi:tetratricopeptide (TPR) repeat protein
MNVEPVFPDDAERARAAQLRSSLETFDAPSVDVITYINDSHNFLTNREPEMTAEEYALYEKAISLMKTNSAFALKMLEAMMGDKKAPSPAFEFILGNVYYAAEAIQKAEMRYRSAVERLPTFLRAWNNLGVLYYSANRYAEAVPCFSQAIVLGDRDPTTFGLLGYCLEQADDIVSAEMAYMQALAGAPADAGWKEGLLRIYIRGRQFGRAESLVRTLIKERPTETRFWMAYANILISDQRKLKALALLEIVSAAGLAGSTEFALLGDLYAEQGLHSEAAGTYAKLLAADVALGEQRLLQLALSLQGMGLSARARATLDALPPSISDGGRLQALQLRAELLAADKQWSEADTVLEELLAVAPMNGRAWVSMGLVRTAQDKLDQAKFAFETALRDESNAYRARLELANLEVKLRHYPQAAEHLKAALSIEDSAAIRDSLSRIQSFLAEDGEFNP